MIILETAVGRKKDAYGIGVHSEIKKFVVTLLGDEIFFLLCEVRQEFARTFVIQLRFLGSRSYPTNPPAVFYKRERGVEIVFSHSCWEVFRR